MIPTSNSKFIYWKDRIASPNLQINSQIVHNIIPPSKVKGNARESWNRIEFDGDDRVEFKELHDIHRKFPRVFEPAFMLQNNMMTSILGLGWWASKVCACILFLFHLLLCLYFTSFIFSVYHWLRYLYKLAVNCKVFFVVKQSACILR